MTETVSQTLKHRVMTSLIITCVFFYFLIFAQFAFIHRLTAGNPPEFLLETTLFSMGGGGIGGCILAARRFRYASAKSWLISGFVGCGLTAIIAANVSHMGVFVVLAMMMGVMLGSLTVVVIPVISRTIPIPVCGSSTALGVGSAYVLSNVPWIFNSPAIDQCFFAALACVLGALLSTYLPNLETQSVSSNHQVEAPTSAKLYQKQGLWLVIMLLMTLIWLDSAAFYIIQESAALKSHTWASDKQLWWLAWIHFTTALAGGWCLNRGWLLLLLLTALLALSTGAWLLVAGGGGLAFVSILLYVTGVSLYSTALVAFAALRPEVPGSPGILVRAALVFAVAGWFGSGMGIGMARDLHTLPPAFIVIALTIAGISTAAYLWVQRATAQRIQAWS